MYSFNLLITQGKIMVRTYKRKTNRASTTPHTMLKAVRQVLLFKKTIRAAAEEFGINYRTLARYCTKIPREEVEGDAEHPSCAVGFIGARQVFSAELEMELVSNILTSTNIYYALPPKAIRKLSYQLAKRHQLQMPSSWRENKQASADWFAAFTKRHPSLSIRSPEPMSVPKASPCTTRHVEMFYSKLKEIMERHRFKPEDVWNVEEIGVTTAQRADRVVIRKALVPLGPVSSADRGPLVSVACVVSASGNTIPPYFVFPRVQFREHFLNGSPVGSSGGANLNGWMREEQFVHFLQHFTRQTKRSPERPGLLLLDSHLSYLSIEGLSFAKSNGIVMLSFPPHCSRHLQPLERSVYSPFKKFVNAAIDSWMLGSPGRSVTIHHVPGIVATALPLSATPANIMEGFKACGIYPLNPNIVHESEFALSCLTDCNSGTSASNGSAHNYVDYIGDTPECPSSDRHTAHGDLQPKPDELHSYQRLKTSEQDSGHLDWLS